MDKGQIILYQTLDGESKIEVRLENDTVWLSADQMAELFQRNKSTISRHIKNVLEDGELDSEEVVAFFATTTQHGAMEGKTQEHKVAFYNLDMIISVGYRVHSYRGVQFRIWATKVLKEYIVKGFALNDDLLKRAGGGNYFDELLARIRDIRSSEKVLAIAKNLPIDMDKVKSMSLSANSTPGLSINVKDGVRKVYQLIFDNIGKNGFVGRLDTSMQSDGTLRALTLLSALYYACKLGKTVVVDEINCCLSPTMVKGIVEYFAKTNGTTGQLIFTTHDNQLLDEKDILRSDEIWFVDKREGASVLYSHNDFKEHHTISPYRGYNEGRYGAIRFVKLIEDNAY